jgi:hypothetical protein
MECDAGRRARSDDPAVERDSTLSATPQSMATPLLLAEQSKQDPAIKNAAGGAGRTAGDVREMCARSVPGTYQPAANRYQRHPNSGHLCLEKATPFGLFSPEW